MVAFSTVSNSVPSGKIEGLNYTCHSIRVGTNQIVRTTDSDTVTVLRMSVRACAQTDVCCSAVLHCNSVTVSGTYYLISTDSNRVACVISI